MNMNPGIGASLTAILDEVVPVHAPVPVDATQSVAPEIARRFLCLPGRDRGRGKRSVLRELD